ncbi:ATP-binding protein [Ammoniphilus sp. CFH 90114]|uniref:ATP-binding protein n=1 Tax=Ammoniphilus sp. CFH 90114 TaxID=2493665 RepID=UPI00100F3E00|nr:ATP-binding protein [Ammoniphilus sp. CFH 90114]RXT06272.1 response regulator [Ammoniphilus sp. CFH 90114]
MHSYFNKSINRRFLFIMMIVFTLAFIGIMTIFSIEASIKESYKVERDELIKKQNVVKELEHHYTQMILRERGFLAFQSQRELQASYLEGHKLTETLSRFQQFPLNEEEKQISRDLSLFTDKFIHQLLPRFEGLIEKNDYYAIREISQSGTTDTINSFLEYMEHSSSNYNQALQDHYDHFLKETQRLNYLLLAYVIFLLAIIQVAIRRITKDIGRPIQELSLTSEQLAAGNIGVYNTPYKNQLANREDELGVLTRSFENMVLSLQSKEEELYAHNEELLAQQDELTDQRNKLERSLAEQELVEAKLIQSLDEVEKNRTVLMNLNRLNHDLSISLDRSVLLDSVLAHTLKIYSMDKAMIVLLNDRNEYSSIGISKHQAEKFKQCIQDSLVIRLEETKEPFLSERTAEPYEQGYHENPIRVFDLYLPVYSSTEELIAVFISSRLGSPFHVEEINELTGVMNRVSLSLEKISLYEETESNRQVNQDIIDHVNEGIQLVDLEGQLLQTNRTLCHMLGWEDNFDAGLSIYSQWSRSLEELSDMDQGLTQYLHEAVFGRSSSSSYQYNITHPRLRVIKVYAQAIYRNQHKIGTLLVHRDITAEYEIDQMKSDLVSTVSHELRTPLTNVLGFAELMITRELKPDRQRKYLETIYKEASRLTSLINDFLDLQRMESGKQSYQKVKFELVALVKEVMDSFKYTTTKHQITVNHPVVNTTIYADKEKMVQVFTNLISNAVKFSPHGGDIIVNFEENNEQLLIHVSDQGLGIPPEEQSKLFQKFHRIKHDDRHQIGGTGLGLAICKEIIAEHGGNIEVKSELGSGSIFTVILPLPRNQELDSSPTKPSLNKEFGTVIVIEDDLSLAMLLTDELTESGFYVKHYTDGILALSEIKQHTPAAIVIDLMLGDSPDGWKVIEELKKSPETQAIPIFISSALDEKEKGRTFGAKDYLIKPYPPSKLSSILLQTLLLGTQNGEIHIPHVKEKEV